MEGESQHSHVVYVVSDATGGTARRVVEAALAQFSGAKVQVEQIPGVRDAAEVRRVIKNAATEGGTIVHTLALPELRRVMLTEGRRRHVATIDLMGPLLARLSESLELAPLAKPGLLQQLDESYFERIGAIDFSVRHDDGRNPDDLPEADLVLVGVSRTSKTPISIFLAYRGWRVANVPIVANLDPPPALFRVDRRKIVALTILPERLAKLRQARLSRLARGVSLNYAQMDHIQQELDWGELILRRERWATVDVTNKSIEECASEIIALQDRRVPQGV
ncbi:MAG TPA: pyruvate, water dikinase regulatory protein [Anaerolineae bacterium]|nr:pyruvate, water dikinase regulatory protein [Anaerolineae bacterium]